MVNWRRRLNILAFKKWELSPTSFAIPKKRQERHSAHATKIMSGNDLMTAILGLTAEKDLPRDVVVSAVEEALAQTYRKQYGVVPDSRVSMNLETGHFTVLGIKTVVIDVRDERTQISLKDAQDLSDPGGLGDVVEVDITPDDFSRIGAQSARSAILQRIHDAERDLVYTEFAGKEGELMVGVIRRLDSKGVIVDLGRVEGLIPPPEQVERERYRVGQHLRAYTVEVTKGARMPSIILSRSHKNLVRGCLKSRCLKYSPGSSKLSRSPASRGAVPRLRLSHGRRISTPSALVWVCAARAFRMS